MLPRLFKPQVVLIVFLALALGQAKAAGADVNPPKWVTDPQSEDASFRYYVGQSQGAKSLKEAEQIAFSQALEDTVRENYGVETSIEKSHYLTDSNTLTIDRVQEKSKQFHLKSFKKVSQYFYNVAGSFYYFALYKYAKSEIESEKLRLLNGGTANLVFNELESQAYSTEVSFRSDPSGAKVIIDGELRGQTPLKIKGILATGIHKIEIDHDNFETLEQEIVLVAATPAEIKVILKPAIVEYELSSVPEGAKIYLDSKPVDSNKLQLVSGKKYRIQILHPDYLPYSIDELEVKKGEKRIEDVKLPPRPAMLELTSSPNRLKVEWENGTCVTPCKLTLPPRYYRFIFQLDGFETTETNIVLGPNERVKKNISISKSTASTEYSTREFRNPNIDWISSAPLRGTLAYEYWGAATQQLELGIGYAMLGLSLRSPWGLGAAVIGGSGYGKSENKPNNIETTEASYIGGQLFLEIDPGSVASGNHLLIGAEQGQTRTKYIQRFTTISSNKKSELMLNLSQNVTSVFVGGAHDINLKSSFEWKIGIKRFSDCYTDSGFYKGTTTGFVSLGFSYGP